MFLFVKRVDGQVSLVNWKLSLKPGLHEFPSGTFGSVCELIHPGEVRERDTLVIACSEQGAAPDNISFATPNRCVILQNLAATMPSHSDCQRHEGLCCDDIEKLFDRYEFRHVIVCGHLDCGVIRNWLRPIKEGHTDIGNFRQRFESGTRDLVDQNYQPANEEQRYTLMICEHVLCQIENLLTHPFVADRIRAKTMSLYGWVVDDESARVMAYSSQESTFVPI